MHILDIHPGTHCYGAKKSLFLQVRHLFSVFYCLCDFGRYIAFSLLLISDCIKRQKEVGTGKCSLRQLSVTESLTPYGILSL